MIDIGHLVKLQLSDIVAIMKTMQEKMILIFMIRGSMDIWATG